MSDLLSALSQQKMSNLPPTPPREETPPPPPIAEDQDAMEEGSSAEAQLELDTAERQDLLKDSSDSESENEEETSRTSKKSATYRTTKNKVYNLDFLISKPLL